jgi:hypothetical protein
METILVSVISVALVIITTLTMTFNAFQSTNGLADSWKKMEAQSTSIRQTEIRVLAADNYQGGQIDLWVKNEGKINLDDYPSWDVIIQYQSGNAYYLSYAVTYPPGPGKWTVNGIFVADDTPEVFDPNILNPEEMMLVAVNPETEIGIGEMAKIIVSTPNGVTCQCFVTRQ